MIISHKHKFIFVRPRKTAGTTMQNVLSKICGEDDIITSGYDEGNRNIDKSCWDGHPHPHLWDIKNLVGNDIWNDYYKFTFVRNPFDITVSRFFWNIIGKGQKGYDTTKEDFKRWFKEYTSTNIFHDAKYYSVNLAYPFLVDMNCMSQNNTPIYPSGKLNRAINLDFVGRYENLQSDFNFVCDTLGLENLKLKDENTKTKTRKNKINYKEWYDEKMVEVMYSCFEKDFDLLGYEFEQDFSLTKKSICVDRTIFQNVDKNINGASLIKVPDWITNPLGKYYLYFASHTGKYIRLAYSDCLTEPFKIYDGEVLRLTDTTCKTHIASPDVHIDDKSKKIKMYYHGDTNNFQESFISESNDGLSYTNNPKPLGLFYFRVFRYNDKFYSIAKNKNEDSIIYESDNWDGEYKPLFTLLPNSRHTATLVKDDILYIFYTTVGESPESIYYCKIKLADSVNNWDVIDNKKLTKPTFEFEGAGSDLIPSNFGSSTLRWGEKKLNELRDPCIYREGDDLFLLYSFNGEGGIALGSLNSYE
tara:strand:+ start:1094 stop:2683 length:1590 start_codon:yes stop_codon:yes gene_type:complete